KIFGSIKGRLVLYFVLLVMVPFLILGLMAYQSEKAALRERIRGHLTSIADIQKARIRAWIGERMSDARFLSTNPRIQSDLEFFKSAGDPARYSGSLQYKKTLEVIESIKKNHGYLEVVIMDEKGRIIVSTDREDLGETRSDEGYFKGALKLGPEKIFIQDIYNDPHLNRIAMAFSGPVYSSSDPEKTTGVVALVISMDESFYPIFEGWPGMGRTGDTILARIEDNYVVFLNRLRFVPDAPLNLMFPVNEKVPRPSFYAASGKEGIIEAKDYRDMMVLAAYRFIPETRWGLVVKEDYDDAFASVNQLTRKVALTMGATLILVFLLIYLVSTRIADPIISINTLAGRIAHGDFSARLPVKGRDELASLAASFNDMASSLEEYKGQVDEKGAELEKANRELSSFAQSLEEKVKTRTQELEDLNRALISMMEDLDERTDALEKSQDSMRKFALELEESRNRVRENLDIVERANVELRRIDRMKDHFLGMMSHELRTPLSLITGYSSNLITDKSVTLDSKVHEAVEGVMKGAERLRTIITEMLDVSQIDAKGLRLTFTPSNIGVLMEDVIKELGSFVKERRQEVAVGDYGALPEVPIDRKRMHQVLVNILGNAIKFTPDGGRIEVGFRQYDDDCTVMEAYGERGYLDMVVHDSGIGLDADELERIFEKFYEVGEIDKHATSKYGFLGRGVGLGLPIARGIVEAHGGKLWAESEGYDPEKCPGSSFHIMLPVRVEARERVMMGVVAETRDLAAAAAAAAKAGAQKARPVTAPAAGATPGGRPKVLVIEDDLDIIHLTERVLGEEFEVISAGGGREGIEKTRAEMPALVLLDIYMEDISGYDVCDTLKQDPLTAGVAIAMFTAGVQRWEVERGYKCGAADYITKPFKPDELLAKVRELVRQGAKK
ncbi:MAG TPA: ATP-binding protein, partial [Nitrospirota bacterium]|nr:ATP-binding protein [Nitrospirota bacterium]